MRNLALIGITLIGAIVSLSAHAAAPVEEKTITWYDVELVIFRNLDTRSTETWPTDAGVPDVDAARALFPAADAQTSEPATSAYQPTPAPTAGPETPTPYVPLDASAHQLNGVVASLRRSSKYEPLLHVAWTQPPLEREQAPSLRITLPDALQDNEEPLDEEPPLLGRETDEQAEPLLEEIPEFFDDEPAVELVRPFDGTVQLSVSRYLHLDLDLIYLPDDLNVNVLRGATPATREWTEQEKLERQQRREDIMQALARGDITVEEAEILSLEPEEQRFQGFRLDQYRRLRSREIHYFDHPVFSVIAVVTPRQVTARTMEMDASRGLQ